MPRKKKRSKQPSQVPPLDKQHIIAMFYSTRPVTLNGRKRWLSKGEVAELAGVSRMTLYRWEQRKDYEWEKEKMRRKYLREVAPKRKNTHVQKALMGDIASIKFILNAQGLL